MRRTAVKSALMMQTLLGLLHMTLPAQENPRLSRAERALLGIILPDTASSAVCYLPGGFRFGMNAEADGHFILLKSGSTNHLLRDGGEKVYVVSNTLRGPEIRRLDHVEQVGNNYGSMAFIRKGRIHSYGGYGMWRNVDYFTVFDLAKGDWTPLNSTNTLKNEHCFHFYDPGSDRFFVKGSHFHVDSEGVDKVRSLDSLYRFDFADSTWRTMGRIGDTHRNGMEKIWLMNTPSVLTPFGLVEFKSGEIDLLDMPGNGVFRGRETLFRSYHRIKDRYSSKLSNHSVILHLRDTAFFLFGSADSVFVEKIRLTRDDFLEQMARPIYDPVPTGMAAVLSKSKRSLALLAGLLLLGMGTLLAWRRYGNGAGRVVSGYGSSQTAVGEGRRDAEDRNDPIPSARFLDTLNAGERDMLKQLLEAARKGETMDIETMNKILGVARKDEPVQKTRRSIAVSNINEAFRIGLRREGHLVERVRDSADKRKYLYRIADTHMETLARVFGEF